MKKIKKGKLLIDQHDKNFLYAGKFGGNYVPETLKKPIDDLTILFAKLRKASLVKSVRGPGGGYLLNVNAEEVTLTQIIEAVDENIDLRRCHGSKDCNRGKQCLSHHLWCEVSDQIRGFLSTRNLQQVMDDYQLTQSLNVN